MFLQNIDIIIVNWNSGHLLHDCLQSIVMNDNIEYVNRIYVVDNNSTDKSLDHQIFHPKIFLIKNSKNVGFAKAANQGFKRATGEYVLLLNPDTRLLPNTLSESLQFVEINQDVDILGCQLIDEEGKVLPSCSRFPTPLGFVIDALGLPKIFPKIFKPAMIMEDWNHKDSRFVDQVMGAFMFMHKKIFDKIGYFDEQFFVYYEELDFSKRLAEASGKTFFNAKIKTIHFGKGTTNSVKGYRLYLNLRSKLKYSRKHFARIGFGVVWFTVWIIEPVTRCMFSIFTRKFNDLRDIVKGYRLLLKNIRT